MGSALLEGAWLELCGRGWNCGPEETIHISEPQMTGEDDNSHHTGLLRAQGQSAGSEFACVPHRAQVPPGPGVICCQPQALEVVSACWSPMEPSVSWDPLPFLFCPCPWPLENKPFSIVSALVP
jgi:hypothetical protein